jgi:hypothetical protein
MRLGKRRLDDRTTEWITARYLPTTARNRIPLRNSHSSRWIRATDLTIMSGAPPYEGRAQAGTGGRKIPARRPFRGTSWSPRGSARIHAGGPVVDPTATGSRRVPARVSGVDVWQASPGATGEGARTAERLESWTLYMAGRTRAARHVEKHPANKPFSPPERHAAKPGSHRETTGVRTKPDRVCVGAGAPSPSLRSAVRRNSTEADALRAYSLGRHLVRDRESISLLRRGLFSNGAGGPHPGLSFADCP